MSVICSLSVLSFVVVVGCCCYCCCWLLLLVVVVVCCWLLLCVIVSLSVSCHFHCQFLVVGNVGIVTVIVMITCMTSSSFHCQYCRCHHRVVLIVDWRYCHHSALLAILLLLVMSIWFFGVL